MREENSHSKRGNQMNDRSTAYKIFKDCLHISCCSRRVEFAGGDRSLQKAICTVQICLRELSDKFILLLKFSFRSSSC
ncbi:hypothetical protein MPTK1_3g20690 [Marchantia polymorpha subsp. ruderalis]|uniref:Uncharacterized protein n=2 Tax=Marchantia polymorpha TaxID=3197 RepID=A0AAF6B303_MARPO|nr:hypothetical protein MARPO_0149s0035 [Marchantia polymorpha]BBN06387.1 hypothetical protein Mp_3g20690 [Marchantia polymorpha subsp. ruderalis]|eukprot:PTQ29043.1 hypothetical protein MARPO_0149s0035 [Marchantia polymorpha]